MSSIRKISAAEFTSDVNEARLTKDELAEKYALPKVEVGRIMKQLNLKITRKKHVTYLLDMDMDDVVEPTSPPQQEASSEPIGEAETHTVSNGSISSNPQTNGF